MSMLFNMLAMDNVETPIDGATGVWLKSGGVTISSAMKIQGVTVNIEESMYIYSRGSAVNCVGGGILYASNGGMIIGGGWSGGNIYSGATATDMHTSAGTLNITNGAVIASLIVSPYPALVLNNASVSGVLVESGGSFRCGDGTTYNVVCGASRAGTTNEVQANRPTAVISGLSQVPGVPAFVTVYVRSAAQIFDVAAVSGWAVHVSSAAIVERLSLESGGSLHVYSGGTALAVTSNAGAKVTVSTGGYIEYAYDVERTYRT